MHCEDCGGTGHDIGALNPHYPEDCRTCNGSGTEPEYEDGDRIRFRDQETGELRTATILEQTTVQWYECRVDGISGDTWGVHVSLIRGRLPVSTLEQQLAASIAAVNQQRGIGA